MLWIWNRGREAHEPSRTSRTWAFPGLDALEGRRMLSSTPTDYVLSGYSWPDPSKITYSFPPDGVNWDEGVNDLNSALDAQFGNASWIRDIAEALQTWASVANINVVMVPDQGGDFNEPGLSQGDPRFGDIRIGGYNFDSNTVLAQTYSPPPNGITAAGDSEINTGFFWGPGAQYDLYSVMLHEMGLALGMGETTDPTAVMNRIYGGVRTGLEPVDIAGIQAIYGPRTPDSYQAAGEATTVQTAVGLNGMLTANAPNEAQANLTGLSLNAIGDTEFFKVVAPWSGGPETISTLATAYGISSMSPKVTIYDASMQALASAALPSLWGDGVTATATVMPGQTYIIAVTGATDDVFSVGAYALQVTFSGLTPVAAAPASPPTPVPPTVPPPPPPASTLDPGAPSTTTVAIGPAPTAPPQAPPIARDRFEPDSTWQTATDLGSLDSTVVTGLTIVSADDDQVFSFVAADSGSVTVSTGSTALQLVDATGQTLASGTGQLTYAGATAGTRYWIAVAPASGQQTDPGFSLAIAIQDSAAPAQQVTSPPAVPALAAAVAVAAPSPSPSAPAPVAAGPPARAASPAATVALALATRPTFVPSAVPVPSAPPAWQIPLTPAQAWRHSRVTIGLGSTAIREAVINARWARRRV